MHKIFMAFVLLGANVVYALDNDRVSNQQKTPTLAQTNKGRLKQLWEASPLTFEAVARLRKIESPDSPTTRAMFEVISEASNSNGEHE